MRPPESPKFASKDARSRSVVVLLSACIHPNVLTTQRQDPAVRMRQYGESLRKWGVAEGFDGLVFCENSGADLTELEARAQQSSRHDMEFLSFKGARFDPALGKGFGEMAIIGHALKTSRLIAGANLVLKVTGRIYVRNIKQLAQLLRGISDVSVFCDLRRNLTEADSRVFCASRAFIRDYLLPRAQFLNDSKGAFFEHVLAKAAHAAMADGLVWAPLPRAHWMDGVGGAADEQIRSSLVSQLRRECFRAIKNACLKR